MAYEFTFTPRFQKHFKDLTVQEKKQLKNKLELLAQNPSHPLLPPGQQQYSFLLRIEKGIDPLLDTSHSFL